MSAEPRPRSNAEAEEAGAPRLGPRLGQLRIRHLELLDRIHRLGSLSAAAASVGVSQPRATNMLHEVEDAFGRPLLDRSSRGSLLNASGRSALERLRVALGALDAAQATLKGGMEGPVLRIGVLPLVGSDRLSKAIADLDAEGALPRIVLRVGTVGHLIALLLSGEVDCMLSGLDTGEPIPPAGERLRMVRLWEEPLLVVAARGHPILRKARVTLDEIRPHPWLLMDGRSANRQMFERMFLRAGLQPPEPLVEAESPHIGISIVAASRMLGLFPESAYRMAAERLGRVRLDVALQPTRINLITLGDIPSLPFVEVLAERLRAAVPGGGRGSA